MENKIKTKKAMLEVIELLAGVLESNTEDKKETIKSYSDRLDELASEENTNRWDVDYCKDNIERCKLWIAAASDVMKTLEKLI